MRSSLERDVCEGVKGVLRMKILLVLTSVFCLSVVLLADCGNVHCRFEYLGHDAVAESTEADFLAESAVSGTYERYFRNECRPFRELDWHLNRVERSAAADDYSGCSNAVSAVARLLVDYAVFFRGGAFEEMLTFPQKLRMLMLEKIEYSMARLVLGKGRDIAKEFLDTLLPDTLIDKGRDFRLWHSVRTFKTMLIIACAVEDYHDREGCPPLNLNLLKLPERIRKCACGRDIEYECHALTWVLRSRCESFDGGLAFDEYIPMIGQRKRLDLCFSPSYNRKRRMLYDGEGMNTKDIRLTGRVNHDVPWSGVHIIKFTHPSAGCTRIVPLSECEGLNKKESSD